MFLQINKKIQCQIWLIGLMLISMFLTTSYAIAKDVPEGGMSIGVRGAFYEPSDADEGEYYGGAQLRLHLTPALTLEGSIDYRRNDFDSTKVHTYPVQASILGYLMPGKRVTPFVLGGAGWYYTTVEGPGDFDDTQNRFGLHAGLGLQLYLNKYVSIDGTYRYIWLEKIESRDDALVDKDFDDDGHMGTVGLNFHF